MFPCDRQIQLSISRGKDFTGDIIELNSITDPSSFIGSNGIDYELWAYGWDPFITESKVRPGPLRPPLSSSQRHPMDIIQTAVLNSTFR